jgi:hypothetical protein
MIEAALLMIPLLVLVFNAINIGYIFMVLVNITGAPRSAALYCVLGSATPLNHTLPPTGPGSAIGSVSYLAYQDMGEIHNGPFGAGTTAVRACSSINGITNKQTSNQITTCTTANTGTFPAVSKDPENVSSGAFPFLLDEVNVNYSFNPLIPGALFNVAGRAICGGADACTFTRSVKMREMN